MIAFLINAILIGIIMWFVLKLMYPKPPKYFLAKEGEDTRLRRCSYCNHILATHRGLLEDENGQIIPHPPMPETAKDPKPKTKNHIVEDGRRFFCNDEHRAAFYAQNTQD